MCIFTPIRRLLGLFVGAGVLAVSACGTDQGPLEPDPQTLSPEVSFARVGKSPVCHWSEDDERFFKIRVAERAIPAHLRHGDGLIGAPVPDQGGMIFDESCVPVPRRILIDASKDGGVWWFPQAGPFSEAQPHQGKQLADYMRSRGSIVVELGRDAAVTPELLSQYSLVVIAGSYSPYASSEVAAYADFVSRDDARLLILPSGSQGGSALSDIAALLELDLARSAGRTSPVVGHPLTDGLGHWYFSGLAISPSSSADLVPLVLMDDGHLAMAEITSEPAEIVFYGDITPVWMMIEPLYANLVTWLLR